MKKSAFLFALTLCAAPAGCSQPAPPQGGEPAQVPSGAASTPPAEEPTTPAPAEGAQTATLYTGTRAKGFTEHPMTYGGELTPELLIQGIAGLTGWSLTLAGPVISGKGGMSVCLSNESALFTGLPDPQKEEFFMFGPDDPAETLLDSIQKILQKGFVLEPGDPDTLGIWYFMEEGRPPELPGPGKSWPIDQTYQRERAKSESRCKKSFPQLRHRGKYEAAGHLSSRRQMACGMKFILDKRFRTIRRRK